jgi:hypothetical protein
MPRRVSAARFVRPFVLCALLCTAIDPAIARAQQAASAPAADQGEAPAIKVVPFGIVYFNLFSNDSATNNADVPLWATSGPGNVSASGRQTRFGLRVTGATFKSAKVSAVVEADFFGGYPAIGIGDNMGVLRLRLANARLDWKQTSVVVGQDWMVFAPANPQSLAAAGIPLLAAAGNPWARLPQVRGEWRSGSTVVQGAVLAPSTGDFSSAFLYQPGSGALSQWPFLQGRAAYTATHVGRVKRPLTLAVSGHYGQSRVLTPVDRTVDSRGLAADWSVPLGRMLTLTGEAFAGRNLAAFQAGVFQGINAEAVSAGVPDGPRSIGTRGGWAQVLAAVTPAVTVNAAYGLDDPRDEDLQTPTHLEARVRNTALSFGIQHKATAQITWGLEYRHILTAMLVAGNRTADHVNLAVTFAF